MMRRSEFVERTGVRPTPEEFPAIYDIYNCSGMETEEFCAMWKKKKFRELLDVVISENKLTEAAYRKDLERIRKMHQEQETKNVAHAEFLLRKAESHKDADFYNETVKLIEERDVIMVKNLLGLPLWQEDLDYISNNKKQNK